VLTSNGQEAAMLQSLIVPGCIGGMRPPFQLFVHHYQCELDAYTDQVHVRPTALWLPGENAHARLSIGANTWRSGADWVQTLDDANGAATVRVAVTSPNMHNHATYVVSALGVPLAMRRTTTTSTTSTTLTTTTSATSTLNNGGPAFPWISTETTSPHGYVFTTETFSTSLNGGSPWFTPPDIPEIHIPGIPTLKVPTLPPLSSLIPSSSFVGSVVVASSWLSLLLCESYASCIVLLKQFQFVGLTASHAPPTSRYRTLALQYSGFNLWVKLPVVTVQRLPDELDFPSEPEPEPERELSERQTLFAGMDVEIASAVWLADSQSRIGHMFIVVSALPILVFFVLCGYKVAQSEEAEKEETPMPDAGLRGLRARMLPIVLCILDVTLVGFSDAVASFIFAPMNVLVDSPMTDDSATFSLHLLMFLFVVYPVCFCALGFFRLSILHRTGRLIWSRLLGLFSDARTLAVTLRGPSFSAWSPRSRSLGVLSWLFASEFRSVVPLQAVDGGAVQLTTDRRSTASTAVNGGSGRVAAEDAELATGLLSSKASPIAAWRRRQEQLGLLLWMERRCAAYEALKEQIQGAERNGVITEASGSAIYDGTTDLLSDLYQYCIYQFPLRPWQPPRIGTANVVYEPFEMEGGGVKAPWVPATRDIKHSERNRIDTWLKRWLIEAETASRTREELRLSRFVVMTHLQHKRSRLDFCAKWRWLFLRGVQRGPPATSRQRKAKIAREDLANLWRMLSAKAQGQPGGLKSTLQVPRRPLPD